MRKRDWSIRASAIVGVAGVVIGVGVQTTNGWPRYREEFGGCVPCHGDFNSSMSPSGLIFPFESNHLMHRAGSAMNTSCTLCHYDGDGNNPRLDFSDSDGFGSGPGFGCLGCHGRDYGPGFGVMGVGMRKHHRTVGVSSCGQSSCHADDPAPLPEDVLPPYYGSFETRAWDVCNRAPLYGENFTLDTDNHLGLDNDGDGLYDENDPDCDVVASCPGDVDGDGEVGFTDLLSVLAAWGPCDGCPEDIDGDGSVGFTDLLTVLSGWGPCPLD